MNTVPGRVVGDDGDGLAVALPGAEVPLPAELASRLARRHIDDVVVGVRPEHLRARRRTARSRRRSRVVESLGHERHIVCRLGRRHDGDRPPAGRRGARRSRATNVQLARRAGAQFHVFDADDRRRARAATGVTDASVAAGGTREALLGLRARAAEPRCLFGTFVFYPFVKNIWLGVLPRAAVAAPADASGSGFEQYKDVLTSDDFRNSLKVTVQFALLTVPLGIVLGLGLAVLAHQRLRGIGIYRTIFSSTVATSVAVASVIFFTLLNPQIGLIPYWLGTRGPTEPAAETRRGRSSACRSRRSGRTSASRSSSCRRACRASPTSCSRRHASTARARGRASATSRCRCSRRRCSSRRSSARSSRSRRSARSTCSPRAARRQDERARVLDLPHCVRQSHRQDSAAVLAVALFVITFVLTADPAAVPRTAGHL